MPTRKRIKYTVNFALIFGHRWNEWYFSPPPHIFPLWCVIYCWRRCCFFFLHPFGTVCNIHSDPSSIACNFAPVLGCAYNVYIFLCVRLCFVLSVEAPRPNADVKLFQCISGCVYESIPIIQRSHLIASIYWLPSLTVFADSLLLDIL